MTDNVDFKAAKECAISYLDCEDVMPKTFNLSRAYLALCEFVKDVATIRVVSGRTGKTYVRCARCGGDSESAGTLNMADVKHKDGCIVAAIGA